MRFDEIMQVGCCMLRRFYAGNIPEGKRISRIKLLERRITQDLCEQY